MAESEWVGKTFGSGWLHRSLIASLHIFGVMPAYLISAVLIVPICLVFNSSRKTSYDFFRKRLEYGVLKSVWATYENHVKFSQVVIDRFAMYAGRKFDVKVEGVENFNERAARPEAFVHLSAHIGNYEMAGYSLVSDKKAINALVFAGETESVMQGRDGLFVRTNIRMIPMGEDMSCLYAINDAIDRGEVVSLPADRYMNGSRCVKREFLGAEAKFPMGPFSVAAMRSLDALSVNVMKSGLKSYTIYVTPLSYDKNASRAVQVEQLSRAYVDELSLRIRQYPTQWYNFYDFWA